MNLTPSATNQGYTDKIASLFMRCSIDSVVTYGQIKSALGFDVRERRHLLVKAIKIANEESGVVIRAVSGIGYQRIGDGVSVGTKAVDKARRISRRGKQTVVNWMEKSANLDDSGLRRAYSVVTQLGLIEHMSSRRAAPDLSQADLGTYQPVDHTRDTLAAIKEARKKRTG